MKWTREKNKTHQINEFLQQGHMADRKKPTSYQILKKVFFVNQLILITNW